MKQCVVEEEQEGCCKILLANTADHLCQHSYGHVMHTNIPLSCRLWGLWIFSHVL